MNDFEGLLPTNLGFKPQNKSAPMATSKATSDINSTSSLNFELGSHGTSLSTRTSHVSTRSFPDDSDSFFGSTGSKKIQDLGGLDDFLGGSSRFVNKSESRGGGNSEFDLNSMFSRTGNSGREAQPLDSPVFDKPVYDDDIFDGVPGLKSSSKVNYEDVFSSVTSPPRENAAAFDDLLGGFGKSDPVLNSSSTGGARLGKGEKGDGPDFDDLIPGFGGSNPSLGRSTSKPSWSLEPTVPKTTSKTVENPFQASGHNANPFEEINKLGSSGSMKMDSSSTANDRVFVDINPFSGLGKSVPAFLSEEINRGKVRSPPRADMSSGRPQTTTSKETENTSARSPERQWQKNVSAENDWQSEQILFDMPAVSPNSHKSVPRSSSPPSFENDGPKCSDVQDDMSPESENKVDSSEDIWLTVSEVPLFTLPTSAPPPSRAPPPRPIHNSRIGLSTSTNSRKKVNDYSSANAKYFQGQVRDSVISQVDELEEFVMGRNRSNGDESATGISSDDVEMNSAAAAMKEAMDSAEAKFRQAKEVRGRDNAKTIRIKETVQPDRDETAVPNVERFQNEREEERREQRRLEKGRERAREMEMEREEKEREQQRRVEKEREKARELELERDKARQAVERATREARGRAAAEARLKAERAAVQRAQAEARERAAAGAQERAEKAAIEARERVSAVAKERAEAEAQIKAEKAESEARVKAERAAVQRAAAEARERAAADARERAAAARLNQQRSENDLESFFMGGRGSSVPRPRANPVDPFFDTQSQNRQEPEAAKAPSGTSSSMRKISSTTNIVDDLSSIFGAPRSSGEFQDVEGETEERRRARLERHQRTRERAAKALAEKNERDLRTQREQAERHRIAETLDVEIKRWAAGKDGNLRALLSTLQYVLWPESGWQPVSLTDLITGAAVKKGYRKATLCIHPDKVQQKGANLQQKYIAEKVFDILKEAWNKFNSEELF